MTQGQATGWTQSALLLLRKILRGILSPFFPSAEASLPVEMPADASVVSEPASIPGLEHLAHQGVPATLPEPPLPESPLPETPKFNVPMRPEPQSLEELFGIHSDSSDSTLQASVSSLKELLGTETQLQPWTSSSSAPSNSQNSESVSFQDLFGPEIDGEIPSDRSESNPNISETLNRAGQAVIEGAIAAPWTESSARASAESSNPERSEPFFTSSTAEHRPMMNLSLDDNDIPIAPPPEPLELEDTLVSRASRGDLAAFRQLLNDELAAHGVEVFDVESRNSLLQLSICAEEVPLQREIEPIIRTWVLNVGFVKVQKIELYGHRAGSELPHWRSEFDPSDLEYSFDPEDMGFEAEQISPEVAQYLSVIESGESSRAEAAATTMNDLWETATGPTPVIALDEAMPSPVGDEPWTESAHTPDVPIVMEGQNAVEQDLEVSTQADLVLDPALNSVDLQAHSTTADSSQKQQWVKEFLAQYSAGERSFIKIDLSETDLSGVNLTLADLQEAQLVWTNLQDASLYHVNLNGAKLRHANLIGAKLRSANLQGADFLNADLSNSDLTWSNLRGANLTGANLTNADLKNAILENVIMPDGTLLD